MKKGYRPNKIEQSVLKQLVQKVSDDEVIVVHYVLENNHRKLWFQIERRLKDKISFERILIEED